MLRKRIVLSIIETETHEIVSEIHQMTVKEFYQYYDFSEVNVLSIHSDGKGLVLDIEAILNMDFVGNHVRTDFSDSYIHRFIFNGQYPKISIDGPVFITDARYHDDSLFFVVNGKEIRIPETRVQVISNIRRN